MKCQAFFQRKVFQERTNVEQKSEGKNEDQFFIFNLNFGTTTISVPIFELFPAEKMSKIIYIPLQLSDILMILKQKSCENPKREKKTIVCTRKTYTNT